jgi:hypothetical protein
MPELKYLFNAIGAYSYFARNGANYIFGPIPLPTLIFGIIYLKTNVGLIAIRIILNSFFKTVLFGPMEATHQVTNQEQLLLLKIKRVLSSQI